MVLEEHDPLIDRYHAAVDYTQSLIRDPGLRRMRYFLDHIGNPQRNFRAIHVAGTSGKGSTATMIGAILSATGARVGVHTTPYLQTAIETLKVDDRYISPDDYVALVDELRPLIDRLRAVTPYGPLTYSELATGMAFLYFAREHVEYAVIEVGVGGRLDPTNILEPAVSVITTVGFDHMRALGTTLEQIAGHKAGIIKPGIPAVTSVAQPEALAVVEAEARAKGTPLFRLGQEFRYTPAPTTTRSDRSAGGRFVWTGWDGARLDLEAPFAGPHQISNAAVAVAAVRALKHQGTDVPEEALARGLRQARFPGRLETMQTSPQVLLDGAHNPQKAQALAEALAAYRYRRLILVLGSLEAKDSAGMVAPLAPLADTIVATTARVLGKPSASPERIAAATQGLVRQVEVVPEPEDAVRRALALAGPDDLVCITGSLYLIGEIRSLWVSEVDILRERTSWPEKTSARM